MLHKRDRRFHGHDMGKARILFAAVAGIGNGVISQQLYLLGYSTPYATFQDAIDRYNAGKEPADQLPHIPFHGLRHTSATLLIAAHQDVRTVSNRLGHAQASTTMNIYAHALKENDHTASNALENMLCKTEA